VRAAYERGETDEFVKATVVGEEGRIRDGDAVVYFNFRPDRARQLTRALGEEEFSEFDRGARPSVRLATLAEYHAGWPYPVAFPPVRPATTLAATLAARGVHQLHVAETEKYAHVTYFFNGGEEEPYSGEERRLVDSPRDVPTYDHKPEMSARAAADAFVEQWGSGGYGFGIINFANADMVGHTGSIPAAVKAVEAADAALGRILEAVGREGGVALVTADHGNAEQMLAEDGKPHTAHTSNPVPLVVTDQGLSLSDGGELSDLVPTTISLLGLAKPLQMSGHNLIVENE